MSRRLNSIVSFKKQYKKSLALGIIIPFFLLAPFLNCYGKLFLMLVFIFIYKIIYNTKFKKKIKNFILIFCTIIQLKTSINFQQRSASLPYPIILTRSYRSQSLPQLAHIFWNRNLPGIKYYPREKNKSYKANLKYIGSRLIISSITFIRSYYRLEEVNPNNEFPLSIEHFLATSEMLFSILVTSDLFLPTEKKVNPDIIYKAFIFFLASDSFSGSSIPIDPLDRDSLLQM